jgi:hypothetical protein
LTIENKGTYNDKLTIYLPKRQKPIVKEMRKLLKAEGSSLSRYLSDQIDAWWQLHEPGNPQQRMDTIIELGKAYQAPKICGFKNCFRDAVGFATYVPKHKEYALCKKHLKEVGQFENWKVRGLMK